MTFNCLGGSPIPPPGQRFPETPPDSWHPLLLWSLPPHTESEDMKEATSPSGTQTMPHCHPSSEVYSVSLLLNTDEGRFPRTTLNHELHLGARAPRRPGALLPSSAPPRGAGDGGEGRRLFSTVACGQGQASGLEHGNQRPLSQQNGHQLHLQTFNKCLPDQIPCPHAQQGDNKP